MAAITNISAVNFRATANYQTPVKPETKEYNVQDKEVTNKYQAEIDTLDPKLNDENTNSIIQEAGMYEVYNFDGKKLFAESEINSEIIENAVNVYQNIYDEYDYIDKTVASIPQKNQFQNM